MLRGDASERWRGGPRVLVLVGGSGWTIRGRHQPYPQDPPMVSGTPAYVGTWTGIPLLLPLSHPRGQTVAPRGIMALGCLCLCFDISCSFLRSSLFQDASFTLSLSLHSACDNALFYTDWIYFHDISVSAKNILQKSNNAIIRTQVPGIICYKNDFKKLFTIGQIHTLVRTNVDACATAYKLTSRAHLNSQWWSWEGMSASGVCVQISILQYNSAGRQQINTDDVLVNVQMRTI